MDASGGVKQGEGHTGFLHLPFAVLALIFIARRIQPPFSPVHREVELCCREYVRRRPEGFDLKCFLAAAHGNSSLPISLDSG